MSGKCEEIEKLLKCGKLEVVYKTAKSLNKNRKNVISQGIKKQGKHDMRNE